MTRWWMSWYSEDSAFELYSPWWYSGHTEEADIVCAAVIAESEEAAKEIAYACYDIRPERLEFRFVEERPSDWSPFSERFPRKVWMRWPESSPGC